ncbi:MAG: cbb3-type cytochrome c oxidase subunit 3 [Rhizobium sp.]|nr:cbb3-type cytochrome c oxidase subunit 3 [Rhizobium sp.]
MIAGISTVILLVLFLAGVAWAYSRKRKPEFDAAARLPLEDQSENTP